MPRSSPIRRKRCAWAESQSDYHEYHDEEWGVPVVDDLKLFEFLVLEGAQAGLSWLTILRKREGYRKAFVHFDPQKIARFGPAKVERLLQDPSIVRNRAKVEATVTNAKAFLSLQEQFGSFATYQWGFVEGRPIQNRFSSLTEIPASTPLSDKIAKDLKQRGFKFVGTTIVYAHLQAVGVVNDHLVSCHRYREVAKLGKGVSKALGQGGHRGR